MSVEFVSNVVEVEFQYCGFVNMTITFVINVKPNKYTNIIIVNSLKNLKLLIFQALSHRLVCLICVGLPARPSSFNYFLNWHFDSCSGSQKFHATRKRGPQQTIQKALKTIMKGG
jgi:hypothetical protein